jgi:tetratricopeptide (TPR) repeat protein
VTDANATVLAEICRRLDGLPLAIELAAARSRLLPPPTLLARLERRLQLLKGGARDLPGRQQTLRATIDWSHDLLEAGEQTLFARLGVFAGGCTLEAAEAVCDLGGDLDVLTGLDALVDKNLLQPRHGPDGDSRLLMLETIREYALERLSERREADAVARRHADYYRGVAEQAEAEVLGSQQGRWFEWLEADLDNLRTALAWSVAHQEAEVTARLAAPIMPFWVSRAHVGEGLRWLDAALEQRERLSRPALAKTLFARAYLPLQTGAHHGEAEPLLKESLALFQKVGDTTWTVRAVSVLGHAAMRVRDFDRGVALRTQAVAMARDGADPWNLAMALGNLGLSLLTTDSPGRARAALEESLALYRGLEDVVGIALTLYGLAMLALGDGDLDQASSLLEEALALARKGGHLLDAGNYLTDLGIVALHQGDYTRAATLLEEGFRLAQQAEDELLAAKCLWGWAAVAVARGQPARAARLWGAASARDYALAVPPMAVRPVEARLLASARERLSPHVFEAEWAKGQATDLEDVIADALRGH